MGDKSEQKKQYILETARKVFQEKGYQKVTMKDVVDACKISRGGLYLYFPGTRELFLEVLAMEQQEGDNVFARSISQNASPSDLLALFLKEQKKELLGRKESLLRASYEFFFLHPVSGRDNILRQQFDAAVAALCRLIEEGMAAGEFYCEDARRTASNIMYVLEGLKIASQTRGISEAAIDREFMYVLQGLLTEE